MSAVYHPNAEIAPVPAGIEEQLLMVTAHRVDVVSFGLESDDRIQHLHAARATINGVAKQEYRVAPLQTDDPFQQAAEGPAATVYVRYYKMSWLHA